MGKSTFPLIEVSNTLTGTWSITHTLHAIASLCTWVRWHFLLFNSLVNSRTVGSSNSGGSSLNKGAPGFCTDTLPVWRCGDHRLCRQGALTPLFPVSQHTATRLNSHALKIANSSPKTLSSVQVTASVCETGRSLHTAPVWDITNATKDTVLPFSRSHQECIWTNFRWRTKYQLRRKWCCYDVFLIKGQLGIWKSQPQQGMCCGTVKTVEEKMRNYGPQLSWLVRLKEARIAFLADSQNRKCKRHVCQKYFK